MQSFSAFITIPYKAPVNQISAKSGNARLSSKHIELEDYIGCISFTGYLEELFGKWKSICAIRQKAIQTWQVREECNTTSRRRVKRELTAQTKNRLKVNVDFVRGCIVARQNVGNKPKHDCVVHSEGPCSTPVNQTRSSLRVVYERYSS